MPASNLMRRSLVVALIVAVGVPLVALAESYTITMRNGSVFHSRQRPQAAPWDAAKVLLRTDVGNWISLVNADVENVVSDTENRGFGKTINSTTMMLGEAPNDAPSGDDGGGDYGESEQPNYNINQFVEPGKTQGFPGAWLGSGSAGGSSGGAPRPAPAPAPRAATPPAQAPPNG
ncbi:MAG: hypothetical protein ABI609_14450 [Acidobacteriota bacterium]